MKSSFFISFTLLIVFNSHVFGQGRVKPLFNLLELASYDRNNQNKPEVTFYASINSSGKINIVDKRGTKINCYSYILPDSTIKQINTIFSGAKPIKSYMITEKLSSGFHYAGDYSFISFMNKNKNTEYLTYIHPFMSDDFNEAYGAIFMTFTVSVKESTQPIPIRKAFLDKLFEYDKSAVNLPKKELPPPGA